VKKLLITGLNGTLAPKVARAAEPQGYQVIGWNRAQVSPDDPATTQGFLEQTRPDAIVHLAMGSEDWAAQMATYAASTGVPFGFTSTAMVFDHHPNGPHRPSDPRTAQDDYGRYKIRCEDAILSANPNAVIVRIGYQIALDGTGNNMVAHLEQQAKQGAIQASTLWIPATSQMRHTATALLENLDLAGGIYHLDSNAKLALNYFEVVSSLKTRLGRPDWQIVPSETYHHDQRLIESLPIPDVLEGL
jgi:dTDP-4-dehydrorhamnose reductase